MTDNPSDSWIDKTAKDILQTTSAESKYSEWLSSLAVWA